MTDQHRDEPSTRERLTAMESGLLHFRQISDIRNQQIWDALTQIKDHNRRQDTDLEVMEEKLLAKIGKIYALLWSGMKWLNAFLITTASAIVLKLLGIY